MNPYNNKSLENKESLLNNPTTKIASDNIEYLRTSLIILLEYSEYNLYDKNKNKL